MWTELAHFTLVRVLASHMRQQKATFKHLRCLFSPDADVFFARDIDAETNVAENKDDFPPRYCTMSLDLSSCVTCLTTFCRLVLLPTETFQPYMERVGFNTAAYYVNMSSFATLTPKLIDFGVSNDWLAISHVVIHISFKPGSFAGSFVTAFGTRV